MADIPDDVKEQAMQASEPIRASMEQLHPEPALPVQETPNTEIPEHVKATEAVRGDIQMVEHTGDSTPAQSTPNTALAAQVGQKVADMQRNGYDADAIHQELTKDDFVRE